MLGRCRGTDNVLWTSSINSFCFLLCQYICNPHFWLHICAVQSREPFVTLIIWPSIHYMQYLYWLLCTFCSKSIKYLLLFQICSPQLSHCHGHFWLGTYDLSRQCQMKGWMSHTTDRWGTWADESFPGGAPATSSLQLGPPLLLLAWDFRPPPVGKVPTRQGNKGLLLLMLH